VAFVAWTDAPMRVRVGQLCTTLDPAI
jgi:hypothetical protein